MAKFTLLLPIFIVGALGTVAEAGIIISASSTAPTPGADDQYFLPSPTSNFNNYTDQNPGKIGQSFTTGSNPGGYSLDSVTYQFDAVWNITYNGGQTTTKLFSTATPITDVIAPETITLTSAMGLGNGKYVTFTFDTPVALAANTQYAFTFGGGGSMNLRGVTTNDYTGGAYLWGTTPEGSGTKDAVFVAHMTPADAPEPASLGLLAIGGAGLLLRRRKA